MSELLVPVDNKSQDWPRRVANAINRLLARRLTPFELLDAAPANPTVGMTYFDMTLGKVRTWADDTWNDHW